jgi:hypothetical protein
MFVWIRGVNEPSAVGADYNMMIEVDEPTKWADKLSELVELLAG